MRLRLLFRSFSFRKEKEQGLLLLGKEERCSFLRKEKRTGRFTEAPASDSHPAADSRVHMAPVMTASRVLRVRRGQSRKIIYTLLKLGHTISYILTQCYALQGKLAVRVPSAADSSHACGRGLILRYLLMRAGLSTKKSPLPKTRKALLLGGLFLIQNIIVPAAFPSHIRRTLRRSRPYRVP